MAHKFYITHEEEFGRLQDILAARYPRVSINALRRLMNSGLVMINREPATRNQKVALGDVVELMEAPDEMEISTRHVPLEILYEDDSCLVINKPADLAVVPERDSDEYQLMGALLEYLEAENETPKRPMIVHRLDKDTTGALLIAKGVDAMRFYTEQFSSRTVRKEYLAVVRGNPPDEFIISDPLTAKGVARGRVVVNQGKGREAITEVRVEERFRGFALVRAFPQTGRQHQIRVHLRAEGYPIISDPLYSGTRTNPDYLLLSEIKRRYKPKRHVEERPLILRQALHAHRLHFVVPNDGGTHPVTVEASLPADMQSLLRTLRKYVPQRQPS